ncbi:MAG: antitoxin [Acidimicrobiaceae bacterium]|nr:antitoxin [Acidimicrobiaceae bacterium]
MASVVVNLPDELVAQARAAGLNMSMVAEDAIRDALYARTVNEWLGDLASLPPGGIDPAIVQEAVSSAKDELGL